MDRPLVGLDVGTSGVKAVAISRRGEVLASAERGYPLATPQPGWAEQDPEDWWQATTAALADLAVEPAAIGFSGQMHGLVALDDARPRHPPGDPLERSTHRPRVRRDRGADRLRAPGRADGKPCAHGVHRPEVAVAAQPRAGDVRAHPPRAAAQGLRPAAAHRRARHRRRGCIGDAAVRRSRAALERRGAGGPGPACRLAAPRPRVDRDRRRRRPGGGRARRRGRPSGAAVDRARHLRVSSSGPCPRYRPDPQARLHVFCHAVPGTWHAMGVMLSAAGSLRWLAITLGGCELRGADREPRRDWPPGAEGLLFPPYLAGERTPHADPDARGAFTGPVASPRPWGGGARGARGRRLRASRLAGAAARARGSRPRSAAFPAAGRAASCGAGSWPRCSASRSSARRRAEEGAAFGAALLGGVASGRLRRRGRGGRRLRPRHRPHRAGSRVGIAPTRRATLASVSCTPPCVPCEAEMKEDSMTGAASPSAGGSSRLAGINDRVLPELRAPRTRSSCWRWRAARSGGASSYAREQGIRSRARLLRGAARRPRRRGRLHPAAELAARRVGDPGARGRQACALREAARPARRRGRAGLRRGGSARGGS